MTIDLYLFTYIFVSPLSLHIPLSDLYVYMSSRAGILWETGLSRVPEFTPGYWWGSCCASFLVLVFTFRVLCCYDVTISTCIRCLVCLYLHVFVGGLMFNSCQLCLLAHIGVQHILCCFFILFFINLVYLILSVSLNCPLLIAASLFSNMYIGHETTSIMPLYSFHTLKLLKGMQYVVVLVKTEQTATQ